MSQIILGDCVEELRKLPDGLVDLCVTSPPYKNKDGYISRIGELKERDNGPGSGWCYYINGSKASVGMRNLTLKVSDKIEWRYVADGVSN